MLRDLVRRPGRQGRSPSRRRRNNPKKVRKWTFRSCSVLSFGLRRCGEPVYSVASAYDSRRGNQGKPVIDHPGVASAPPSPGRGCDQRCIEDIVPAVGDERIAADLAQSFAPRRSSRLPARSRGGSPRGEGFTRSGGSAERLHRAWPRRRSQHPFRCGGDDYFPRGAPPPLITRAPGRSRRRRHRGRLGLLVERDQGDVEGSRAASSLLGSGDTTTSRPPGSLGEMHPMLGGAPGASPSFMPAKPPTALGPRAKPVSPGTFTDQAPHDHVRPRRTPRP